MLAARTRKVLIWTGAGVAIAALIVFALLPSAIPVELAEVRRGPLQVTVDEDGETRAHDRYLISAPVAGRVERIDLDEGDAIAEGKVVARIWPLPLSARDREEQLARIGAADARVREAQALVNAIQTTYEQATRETQRTEKLVAEGFVSPQAAEQARATQTGAQRQLEAARSRVRSSAAEAKVARAAMLALEAQPRSNAVFGVRAPIAGTVLRIPEKSDRVVSAGTPLLVLGNPNALEVVVDLLTTDAVKVRAGMDVLLDNWGGEHPLRARVRLVEPYAFTKVSALGVEEQRVNVVIDFVDDPGPLGDAYRVEVRIVLWSADDVLKVPASAVFRRGEGWGVFVFEGGRARLREVRVGHRGTLEVEIVSGVAAKERLLRHPSNDIRDGVRVGAED